MNLVYKYVYIYIYILHIHIIYILNIYIYIYIHSMTWESRFVAQAAFWLGLVFLCFLVYWTPGPSSGATQRGDRCALGNLTSETGNSGEGAPLKVVGFFRGEVFKGRG